MTEQDWAAPCAKLQRHGGNLPLYACGSSLREYGPIRFVPEDAEMASAAAGRDGPRAPRPPYRADAMSCGEAALIREFPPDGRTIFQGPRPCRPDLRHERRLHSGRAK